jgi:hypothetical protein
VARLIYVLSVIFPPAHNATVPENSFNDDSKSGTTTCDAIHAICCRKFYFFIPAYIAIYTSVQELL